MLLTVPPKVRNIRFVNIGAHFISLVWDVAEDAHVSSDVSYDVTYYDAEDSAPENASVVITRHPNVTLDDLLPQTKYAFRASTFMCAAFSMHGAKLKDTANSKENWYLLQRASEKGAALFALLLPPGIRW